MPRWRTDISLTETDAFDVAVADFSIFGVGYINLFLKSDADVAHEANPGRWLDPMGVIKIPRHEVHARPDLDQSDLEFQLVKSRIDAGTCELRAGQRYPGVRIEDLDPFHWIIHTENPFGTIAYFFDHLAENGDFTPAADGAPAEFHFPGIVRDQSAKRRTFYKRDNATALGEQTIRPGADDAGTIANFATAGWHLDPPLSHKRLHAMDTVANLDGSLDIARPRRGARVQDVEKRIRKIARGYWDWYNTLTPSERTTTRNSSATEYWTAWIGRVWDERSDFSIPVKRSSVEAAITLTGMDAEDWRLGSLEYWLDRGIGVFSSTVNIALLRHWLGEREFVLIEPDGGIGEFHGVDGSEGLPSSQQISTWRSTDFNEALGTVVTVDAGPNRHIGSGGSTQLLGVASILNPSGATTYRWDRVSGEGGELDDAESAQPNFSGLTLVAGDDHRDIVYRLTATNNGETGSATVQIRVAAPMSIPAGQTASVQAGQSDTYQVQAHGGISPYTFQSVSGAAWATIDSAGILTLAPAADVPAGDVVLTVSVRDILGGTAQGTITATVTAA